MNNIVFLSAQHLTTYYLWQVQVCVYNLVSKDVRKEQLHILFATFPHEEPSEEDLTILDSIKKVANVFFYQDNRAKNKYPSSIRPHIIAKHFSSFPELGKEKVFYHDCDVIFRELPPIFNQLSESDWYISDTANYLDSDYIKIHIGEENFAIMCGLVGINTDIVIDQDTNCGGAQYIMSNLTAAFWQKVEVDSEQIYIFLQNLNREKKIAQIFDGDNVDSFKGIQSWCADMWAVLWNALYFKQKVKIHSDLDFSWPKNPKEIWSNNYILHNAGVEQIDAEQYFYKGNYIYHTPFSETFEYVNKQSCSFIYSEAVKMMAEQRQRVKLLDITFLIPVMIDSQDRLDNFFTCVRYLQKHFDTNISILEYGTHQIIKSELLPKGTSLRFVQGNEKIFHRTHFINQLIDAATTPYISIFDTDVIIPVSQIIETAYLLRNNETDVVYPYDGTFVNIDKLSAVIFSKFLEDKFLCENKEKFILSSRRSVGGCVILNHESFIKAGGENEKFTSWGPEDVERYNRMKILGFKIKRVSGPLYHMYHERGKNSGYEDSLKYIDFIEEYSKVFNMKKKELEEYVSNWKYFSK